MPFNIGPEKVLVIMVIALIVFGPHRLSEIAASIGKAMQEFRRVASGLTEEILREAEIKKESERQKAKTPSVHQAPASAREMAQRTVIEPSTLTAVPESSSGQGPKTAEGKTCPHCAKVNLPVNRFCGECGTPLA